MSEELTLILNQLENIHYPSGIHHQRLQRYKALVKDNNELEAIFNLVQSHSPGLRNKAVLRYEKLLTINREEFGILPLETTKEEMALKCSTHQMEDNIQNMLRLVSEMPKEWTLIQFTSQYSPVENLNEDIKIFYTNPIHITVFNCGQTMEQPILVTVDAPRDPVTGACVELVQEVMSIIAENKEALSSNKQKMFRNQQEKLTYLSKRQSVEDRLKGVVRDIQNMWLQEWRCLLIGKYKDESLDQRIRSDLTNFFKIECTEVKPSPRIISLLFYVVKGTSFLKLNETKRAVQYCFPAVEDKNLIRSITQAIRNLGETLCSRESKAQKHPVILILDESLDSIPWEMLDVLVDEPVSRVSSLQFIYTLFKEHEKDIVDGHKIVSDFDKGAYVVNPDLDLKNMEVRMVNFFNYWIPNWIGTAGIQPSADELFELLTSSDIFSYNGHGSGSHLLPMDAMQRVHVKAVVLLFGCGSTKINRIDPQVEMQSPYHMYLIARCPCVVGMLWEVSDLDTDVLTTQFMSQWIPSKAQIHWKYVDKTKWNKGLEDVKFTKDKKFCDNEDVNSELELLRALSLAKKSVSYYMTRSACVARGLPVRILDKTKC